MQGDKRYFFCGIGGSGMLPLAMIVAGRGAEVWGSDRSLDQGRIGAKFAWLEQAGIRLFPQDGTGVQSPQQIIVASAAIEDSVPDIAAANAQGCARMTRANLNAALFNAATMRIGVGGTSGKSTVTGMIAWIMTRSGHNPTVMNGAVMRNFAGPDNPFASAVTGSADVYASEVDESDGSIALYNPVVAVVTNISLDHKSMDELRALFGDFTRKAATGIINADDPESAALTRENSLRFGFAKDADVRASSFRPEDFGSHFRVHAFGSDHAGFIRMPGRHNVSNALAAIAACHAAGVPVAESVAALIDFTGLARRYEVVGTRREITVIDDFAHNPDKVAATLAAVATQPGRALVFFQPHGYGPLRQMGAELAEAFATGLRTDDRLFVCDPVYFGGTVDRSVGSDTLVGAINAGGATATHLPTRDACADAVAAMAAPGDRILVLGARDDTLTEFAAALLGRL